jgi:ribA/ribD-fused uncharacterized protein
MKPEIKDQEKFFFIHNRINSVENLAVEVDKGFCPQFIFFWNHEPQQDGVINQSCLSQWWLSSFVYSGVHYQTAEHFMMAQKALLFEDHKTFQEILVAPTPKEAKKLGRTVKNFDTEVWKKKRFFIVLQGNVAKFGQNEQLAEYLLSTLDYILVEASPYDSIWGVGLAEEDARIQNVKNWKGLNLLGFALMQARVWLLD